MKLGILGSGLMGAKLGTIWARAGHEVVFSYARDRKLAQTSSGAEELAKRLPKSHLVAAFGTVPSECFFGVYEARRRAHRSSSCLVYYGDDARAKKVAADLIADVGFKS